MQDGHLNKREIATVVNRDFYVDFEGMSHQDATARALREHVGKPSKAFVEWFTADEELETT